MKKSFLDMTRATKLSGRAFLLGGLLSLASQSADASPLAPSEGARMQSPIIAAASPILLAGDEGHAGGEEKCGSGKCGGDKKPSGEAKCSADKKDGHGKDAKGGEEKCGAGKCGSGK